MDKTQKDSLSNYVCRICGCTATPDSFLARDLILGDTEDFLYDHCPHCHSVQIHNIPSTDILARHYPESYYSRNALSHSPLKKWVRNLRIRYTFGHVSPLGFIVSKIIPHTDNTLPFIASCKIRQNAAILDVGSGEAGNMLVDLSKAGYNKLTGIEPFMTEETSTVYGIKIHRAEIADIKNQYDLIIFNHSLEHTPSPKAALASARKHLRKGGKCIIRLPMADSRLFSLYGPYWVGLEAPRHLSLISRKGMNYLAEQTGFKVDITEDDGQGESYAASIMFYENTKYSKELTAKRFTRRQIETFKKQAKTDNLEERGDGTSFLLSAI